MNDNLPVGAHLVSPRKWYDHHGIHVGNGRVVHYAGFCKGLLHRGPVEEVSLAEFARGNGYEVRPHAASPFTPGEIARRAKNRIGEDCYDILARNCEHFCEWCITGRARSSQVDKLIALPRAWAARLRDLVATLGFAPGA
jgi:hypothetical protein